MCSSVTAMLNTDNITDAVEVNPSDALVLPSRGEGIAPKLLMLIVAILICIGVVIVYSSGAGWAETKYSSSEYFLWRQLTFSVLGHQTGIHIGIDDVAGRRDLRACSAAIQVAARVGRSGVVAEQ